MQIIAVLLIALPFVFGGIRLITSGNDLRYLWTAVASSIGAGIILAWPRRQVPPTAGRTVAGVLVATVCAALCALLLDAKAGPAIAVVSLAFGCCSAGGLSLFVRSRMMQRK